MGSTPQQDTDKSTQTFVTALVLNSAVAAIELVAFVILRERFKQIYSPRVNRPPKAYRSAPLPGGFFAWLPALIRADPKEIIPRNGLDAYVFIRFLRLMMVIFLPFWVITWVILLPVNSVKSGGGLQGLSMFTFGNVGTDQQKRLIAHAILLWINTFWVLYNLKKELAHYVEERHKFLISDQHAQLAQSRTVLVTGVPQAYLTDKGLREEFLSYLPGGVRRTWIARDYDDLPDLYDRQLKAVSKLESAETKLAKLAAKSKFKVAKKEAKANKTKDINIVLGDEEKNDPASIVPEKQRPSHKLGFLGLFGKKVDSIEWAKEEITTTKGELATKRANLENYKPLQALFIEFNEQIAAHMFAQTLAHHQPLRMSGRYLDIAPEAIHWSTLNLNPYEQRVRFAISWVFTIGLIILWAFPVAFVGIISNVSQLCLKAPFLGFMCDESLTPIPGIISGILPPVALAVLFMLLPIVLRLAAIFEGIPTRPLVELSLMKRYFMFQVIHGFLIVTISSGLTTALPQIADNPSSTVSLLAENLPKASIFFLTYLTVQGFSGAAGGLLRIVPLIVYYVKIVLLGSTPRSVYGIKYTMANVAWGTVFPGITLLSVIGLAYSIIAPVINAFAFLAFAFFWLSYKYQFVYVLDQPKSGETGGRFLPMAIHHVFVGLYIQLLCMTGLFFLARNSGPAVSAIPQAITTIILIVIVAGFHIVLFSGYGPMFDYLPLSLAGQIKHFPSPADRKQQQLEGKGQHDEVVGDSEIPNRGSSLQNTNQVTDFEYLHQFDHPAAWREQKLVWLPNDELGIGRREVENLKSAQIDASLDGAKMDQKGTVDVTQPPPDEKDDDLPGNDESPNGHNRDITSSAEKRSIE